MLHRKWGILEGKWVRLVMESQVETNDEIFLSSRTFVVF